MRFSIYLPPQATSERLPVLYWLSGLTCSEENFMAKSGAQKFAAQKGLIVVCPDTSPRGAGIEGEDKDWDFGTGAGFYLDAAAPKWSKNYRMETYVTRELPAIVDAHFPTIPERVGVSGHSMGGHGALTLALRNPGRYRSVSAFSPISAPTQCPWGHKAFSNYLGDDKSAWEAHDATLLVAKAPPQSPPFLVDQGTEDSFLKDQLKPELLKAACEKANYPLHLRLREGYDHSYYFVASFIEEHIDYHAKILKG